MRRLVHQAVGRVEERWFSVLNEAGVKCCTQPTPTVNRLVRTQHHAVSARSPVEDHMDSQFKSASSMGPSVGPSALEQSQQEQSSGHECIQHSDLQPAAEKSR